METLAPPPNLYIPPHSISLDKAELEQIRLGIQGAPGTGKTWAGLTFPNPVSLNLNRGLGAHRGRKDVRKIDIFDRSIAKHYCPSDPDNIKEATLAWLNQEATKLTKDQTLLFDGLSDIETAYHSDWKKHPLVSLKTGKIDEWQEWNLKITYFGEVCDILTSLKCDIVFIAHEAEKRDKGTNEYTGKIRPLMTGQYADRLVGKFTDWFRQFAGSKPKDINNIDQAKLDAFRMTQKEFKAWCDSLPIDSPLYYWQLFSDDTFDGKASSLVNFPKYIPANYENFCKYLRHK